MTKINIKKTAAYFGSYATVSFYRTFKSKFFN